MSVLEFFLRLGLLAMALSVAVLSEPIADRLARLNRRNRRISR